MRSYLIQYTATAPNRTAPVSASGDPQAVSLGRPSPGLSDDRHDEVEREEDAGPAQLGAHANDHPEYVLNKRAASASFFMMKKTKRRRRYAQEEKERTGEIIPTG